MTNPLKTIQSDLDKLEEKHAYYGALTHNLLSLLELTAKDSSRIKQKELYDPELHKKVIELANYFNVKCLSSDSKEPDTNGVSDVPNFHRKVT